MKAPYRPQNVSSLARKMKSSEKYIIFPWSNKRINHNLRHSQSREVGNEGRHVLYVMHLICIYFLINGFAEKDHFIPVPLLSPALMNSIQRQFFLHYKILKENLLSPKDN